MLIGVDEQRIARVSIAIAVDQHMPLRIEFVGVLVERQLIGLNHHIVATDRGVTLHPQHRIRRTLHQLATDESGCIGQGRIGQSRHQGPTALELELPVLRPHGRAHAQPDHRHTNRLPTPQSRALANR